MSRKPRSLVARLLLLVLLPSFTVALAASAASGPTGARPRAAQVAPQRAAHGAEAPAFVLQWGSKGTGSGQFDTPVFIAADEVGFVYVAGQGNHRIKKYDGDGTYVGEGTTTAPATGR